MNLHIPKEPQHKVREGYVYFFLAAEIGAVKVGFSSRPKVRLRMLQTSSPVELAALGSCRGTHYDEQRLHRQFASAHIRGEWFKYTDEVRGAIAAILETGAVPR